jgi:serum/glucocorticoid-regulated kinase 2
MGNSCARGDNRSDVDGMQTTREMNGSPPASVYNGTDGPEGLGLDSSKTSF